MKAVLASVFFLALLASALCNASSPTIATVAGGGGDDGLPAVSVSVSSPRGVAIDGAGNIYFSDTGTARVRKIALDGTVHTLWTGSTVLLSTTFPVYYQGPASCPTDMAFDPSGNLLFLDGCADVIRKLDVGSGTVSVFAGKPPSTPLDPLGDNGPATAASLYLPSAMAVDAAGNVFVSEAYQKRLRKISGGMITTLSGTYYNNVSDPTSLLAGPLAPDGAGGVYAYLVDQAAPFSFGTDYPKNRIVHFDALGARTVVAGDGSTVDSGDGGPASAAGLGVVKGLMLDGSGGLVISFDDRIRRIAPDHTIATIATIGAGALAEAAPGYVATYGDEIDRITLPASRVVVAGTATPAPLPLGDGGNALAANLGNPTAVVTDRSGVMYIADAGNSRIRKVDAAGIISTIAGTGVAGYSGDGSAATLAQLSNPTGLALDAAGNLYIADRGNNRVRRIDTGGVITTYAGNDVAGFSGDGGPANAAQLSMPTAVAVDPSGRVFIADFDNERVRKVGGDGTISTYVGGGTLTSGVLPQPVDQVYLEPTGLAFGPDGSLFVVDASTGQGSGSIWKVDASGVAASVVAFADSGFHFMEGITADEASVLYVSTPRLQRVWRVSPRSILAGASACNVTITTCTPGFAGDGGPASAALLASPRGVYWDSASGKLYFADSGNNRIRAIALADPLPLPFSIPAQSGAAPATPVVSQPVTPSGYVGSTPISVANGEYSIGCSGTFVSTAGVLTAGQSVCVRETSSALNNALTTAVLTVGGRSASFVVRTAPGPGSASMSPTAFDFGSQSMRTSDGSLQVNVTNTGSNAISLNDVDAPASFIVTHDCTGVAAGASCTITVVFAPVTEGSITAVLSLHFTFGDLPLSVTGIGEKSLATHYYRSILRRDPDAAGKAFWDGEAARAASLGANPNEAWYSMAKVFFSSPEYLSFNRNDDDFLVDLYKTFFNRAPDVAGLAYWKQQIASGISRDMVITSFTFSPEFTNFTQAIFGTGAVRAEVDMVTDMYRGFMGRLPDDAGFQYWVGRMRTAQCKPTYTEKVAAVKQEADALTSGFLSSVEYSQRNRTDLQYLSDLYDALLRRGGDTAGVAFWLGRLQTGASTRDQVRQNTILYAPEFTNRVNRVLSQGCLP